MEKTVESIPNSLLGDLSNKLVDIVLGAEDKNAVPADLAKKVIYLWRQDQLASYTGITALMEASLKVDINRTFHTLEELGLNEITVSIRNLI